MNWQSLFEAFFAFATYRTGSNYVALFERHARQRGLFEDDGFRAAWEKFKRDREARDDIPF